MFSGKNNLILYKNYRRNEDSFFDGIKICIIYMLQAVCASAQNWDTLHIDRRVTITLWCVEGTFQLFALASLCVSRSTHRIFLIHTCARSYIEWRFPLLFFALTHVTLCTRIQLVHRNCSHITKKYIFDESVSYKLFWAHNEWVILTRWRDIVKC
jgi:hypothetical protein